jgi:peptidoglycan-N-acetylglucosamine deacetylase
MARRSLSVLAILGLLLTLAPVAPVAAAGNVAFKLERVAGPDRYATAAAISRRFFATAPTVFVATGAGFPDGLAAGPAAARLGGPVLFVTAGSVPTATRNEIVRLAPREIVVVGGPSVISESVRTQLASLAPNGARRIAGADRYDTAAAVAALFPAGTANVYVATGADFPDALSGGAAAAAQGAPVLLTRPGSLPASARAQIQRLAPTRIVLLGGTGAVSSAVETELRALAPTVVRLSGPDRYATADAVSRATFPSGAPAVFIATGMAYPDALAAVPAAARQRAPILLSKTTGIPASTDAELARLNPGTAFLLGSEGALGVGVAKGAQRTLGACWSGNRVAAGAAQTFRTIPNAGPEVALTFDMGGRLDPAIDIMNFLVANQVCATIFPTGAMSQTATGQQVLAIIRAHPHLFEVASHTMHHCDLVSGGGGSPSTAPCQTGGAPSTAFIQRQLTDADAILRAGTGQSPQPYWRPPYGSINQTVINAAASVGYTKTFLWDIDTIDWKPVAEGGPTAAQIADKVIRNSVNGSNVLFHLGGYETLAALRQIVPALRDRGFSLSTLSDLLDGR